MKNFLALSFAITVVGLAPVRAELVFGNLGPTGGTALSGTSTTFGLGDPVTLALAQGFNTGLSATNLTLQAVTIGAHFDAGPAARTVSIYSDSGSNSPGAVLFTSAATSVGDVGKYTFNFTGAVLSAATAYWVVPDFSDLWAWNLEQSETLQPTGQNASGYYYMATRLQEASNPGVWAATGLPYSLSVYATSGSPAPVPEPGTWAAAALLVGSAGFMRWRKRATVS